MTITIPGPLVLFLVVLVLQRWGELMLSARHAKRLLMRGGREHARGHFAVLVLLHVMYPIALAFEVVVLGARPGPWWPMWLGLWLGAQGLRYAAIRALGDRWTVGIWTVPGEPRIRRGPYRFFPHPNYLAVAIELAAGALMFGAWRTAVVASMWNALGLAVRIRAEERALASGAVRA